MAEFNKPIQKISLEVTKQVFGHLKNRQHEINKRGTDMARQAYTSFPKPPIDTGESRRQTTAESTWGETSGQIKWTIGTPYANFFRFGLGNNAKYGNRDVLARAAQDMRQYILNFLNLLKK
jgi:hypothetical protein